MAGGARRDLRRSVPELHFQIRSLDAAGQGRHSSVSPRDMLFSGAVTALASHIDRAPGRVVGLTGRVVVQLQICRMAVGAAGIPVLTPGRPVERIAGGDRFVRVEVEPLALDRVPGDSERLQSAAGKRDQVLLERLHTERVADLEVLERSIRTVGGDVEASVPAEEAGLHSEMVQGGAVKVAENRLLGGFLHGQVVMRIEPVAELLDVAAAAHRISDVPGSGRRPRRALGFS